MDQQSQDSVERIGSWRYRVNGVFLIIGSLGIGVAGWFALSLLADNLAAEPDHARNMSQRAVQIIESRDWIPALVLAPLAAGVLLLAARPSRSQGCLLLSAASVWLLGLFVVILYAFLAFMSPLYQYQPL